MSGQSNGERGRSAAVLMFALVCSLPAQPPKNIDLSQASLEDLMNLPVTSVSKKEQQLSKTGAAVFVITSEDIRRSGATNIPDVLRGAPGVDVARVDANRWAISIRGFNNTYANKVLVLVDGRSVYNPSFSGVFWDMVDVPLEDIERIEVIRGPGGTVWGANAVNGVINIITKTAQATPGGLISVGGGSQAYADGLVQFGGKVRQTGDYRIFAHYFDIGDSDFARGRPASDGWQSGHLGFRSDWNLSPQDSLTVQGDFLKTNESQTIRTLFSNSLPATQTLVDPMHSTGANVLARWKHTLAGGSEMSLQVYDDYSLHTEEGFRNAQDTLDVDFEHHIALGSRNDVVWGLDARLINSNYAPGYAIAVLPNHRLDHLLSGFFQDELKLTHSLSLTIGSKLEHNDFTGIEYEPSAQLVWTATAKQALWASAARAIRQPSAVDVGIQDDLFSFAYGSLPAVLRLLGNPEVRAEQLRDFEAGYRAQLDKRFTLDIAAFGGVYNGLASLVPQTPYLVAQSSSPYLVFPCLWGNDAAARTYGVEFSANWQIAPHWRVSPTYSYFHMNLDGSESSVQSPPGQSPNHQWQVRSQLDLPHHLEWDNTIGYVSALPAVGIPAYTRLDTRLGWRGGEQFEVSVVGQNLLAPRHPEFSVAEYATIHTLVERSIFAKLTFRF